MRRVRARKCNTANLCPPMVSSRGGHRQPGPGSSLSEPVRSKDKLGRIRNTGPSMGERQRCCLSLRRVCITGLMNTLSRHPHLPIGLAGWLRCRDMAAEGKDCASALRAILR